MKLKSRLGSYKNTPVGKSMLRNADWLTLCGGLLYHKYTPKYQVEEVKHFVVPKAHWRTAFYGCHQDAAHQGKKRTESLISDQFWWPGVCRSGSPKLQTLSTSQREGRKAPMVLMMVTAPLQLVHLDFTLFEMTTNLNESPKVKNILVIVDHFTRYTRAYVTKDQKASTAAKTLYEVFILILGYLKGSLWTKARPLPMRW